MLQNGSSGTYNLKAVVQETGLKPDTLRAWERRYGLPNPTRTSGGHRLYSQNDIDMLKWMIARQDEGLSISHAINLWKQLQREGKDPLDEMPTEVERPIIVTTGPVLLELRSSWIEACTEFDERRAEHTLSQALSMYPPETVCLELLQKGMAEIGMGWYEGKMTAQQEHFASALAMRRLDALVAGTPPPTRPERILIGCAPDDEHTFSPLLLTLLLRRRGWEALYLGANMPLARVEATMAAAEPLLVILTAQTLHTAATLFHMAQRLQQEKVPVAFGGLVFSSSDLMHRHIPGHFLGKTLGDSPQMIEALLHSPRPYTPTKYALEAYQDTLQHFLEKQAKLEATVWELMEGEERTNYLARANRDLSQCIIAALTLGDIEFMGNDIKWIEGLLMNFHYRLSSETIYTYIDAYYQASRIVLGGRGQIIWQWVEKVLNNPQNGIKQSANSKNKQLRVSS